MLLLHCYVLYKFCNASCFPRGFNLTKKFDVHFEIDARSPPNILNNLDVNKVQPVSDPNMEYSLIINIQKLKL